MKVGDYVRFKDKRGNTYIRKIVDIPEDNRYASIYIDKEANYSTYLSPKNIIKSSPNIIDLIEVGDFIKYNPVQNHYAKKIILYKAIKDEKDLFFLKYQVQNDKLKILSIVTKEQFESMEYKVGE